MSAFDKLDNLVTDSNGYLTTAQVVKSGISKPTLAEYVKMRNMERVAQGIYLAKDQWEDPLYQLYLSNKKIVFSHETALQLHGLMEREPKRITVSVKAGYNATHLRARGVRVYQLNADLYGLGITDVETNYHHTVCSYDIDRTICDVIKVKEKLDIQVFQYALKEYMASEKKNLNHLMQYAKALKVESLVRTYTEVLL